MDLKKTLKFLKMNESGVRMLLVFVAIVLIGEIFIKLTQNGTEGNDVMTNIGDGQTSSIHVVQTGETLWKIAEKYLNDGFRWQEIANENNIENPNSLEEGQTLVIPTKEVLPTPSDLNNPENTSSISTEAKTHIVEEGDTLWSIAESEFGSGYNWVDIAEANTLKNSNNIEVDQVLFIPNVSPRKQTLANKEELPSSINSDSYIVQKGDNLWIIAVRAYGDGYKWPEIAKLNGLTHPNLIYPDQTLSLPR